MHCNQEHQEKLVKRPYKTYKCSGFIILLFSVLCFLFSIRASAQSYQWQWGITGGGSKGSITGYYPEEIYDIKVGTDSNYYFIASVEGRYGIELAGVPQTTYNNHLGNRDIFLFSTTCDGTVRWSHAVGGGGSDYSYNLVLDSNNNVYIATEVAPWLNWPGTNYPVHFSETEYVITPYEAPGYDPQWPPDNYLPMEFYKKAYLVKYDSNGNYITRKAIESEDIANVDTYPSTDMYREPMLYNLMIDSEDNLHFMGVFGRGNYFDNNITVPASYYYNAFTGKGNMQYRMIKCDSNLDYIRDMILPVTDSSYFTTTNATHFAYDENLSRYYIAGTRSFGSNSSSPTIVYENKAIVNLSYILAINETDGSEIWRREIYSASVTQLADNEITSVVVDTTNSDVYIGGKIWRNNNDNSVKIYDPHNPTTTTYSLSPVPYTYLPTVIKFNNNGLVQWVKQPTAFAPNYTSSTSIKVKGLVLNGNEVALGSSEGYFFWDSFVQNYPQYHGVSPTILRFDKQTGTTVGMDYIISYPGAKNYMTAIAADNDGNYITGGIFTGDFGDPSQNMGMLPQIGESDFFVAKLAASACGTSVSTQKFNTLYVNVYPNPTTDIVNIETNEPLQIYEVYNILGQQIQKDIFNGNNQINLDGVTAGVYFIKIVTIHDRNATVKIMKK